MKKIILIFLLFTGVSLGLTSTTSQYSVNAQEQVICPSGDKYICLDSHGELGTVYRGKGRVMVNQ